MDVTCHYQSRDKGEASTNHRFLPQSSDYFDNSTETGARATAGDYISVSLPVKSDNFLHEVFFFHDRYTS